MGKTSFYKIQANRVTAAENIYIGRYLKRKS